MRVKSRKAGCRSMDDKNVAVLKKILRHTVSIMNYCADCHSREDFERGSMRVEATVFNLISDRFAREEVVRSSASCLIIC